jgi:hypothetical protein
MTDSDNPPIIKDHETALNVAIAALEFYAESFEPLQATTKDGKPLVIWIPRETLLNDMGDTAEDARRSLVEWRQWLALRKLDDMTRRRPT